MAKELVPADGILPARSHHLYVFHSSRYGAVPRLLAAALLALGASACVDATFPAVRAPVVRAVRVDTNDVGAILLNVLVDEQGVVQVDYWTDPARKLRIHATAAGTSGSILLPGLEAGEVYQYSVTGVGTGGSPPVVGTVSTPPLPPDLAALSIDVTGFSTEPITMLEVTAAFRGFVAVDRAGRVVWWQRTVGIPQGMTRRANGNFVLDDAGSRLVEVTPAGEVVHELVTDAASNHPSHHDVIATPENTLLFLAQDIRTVADSTLAGDAIWEWNPETDALVRRWSTFDFYDPSADVGPRSNATDWVHSNSLALGDRGNVILSMNWLDQVISIAPDWTSIEWKLGGRGSNFAVDDDAVFRGQHTAAVLPDGHVLMFDNGRDRQPPGKFSRGLEIALDPSAHVAHRAWEFRTTPDTYDTYVGSARRLPNGNTMVQFGLAAGFAGGTGPLAAYEVSPDRQVVWRATVKNAYVVYRATPLSSIGGEVVIP